MDIKIKSDQLRAVIMAALSDYRDEVNEGVRKAIKKQANEDVRELKATSPKKTGKYAAGWAQKVVENNASTYDVVVYNKAKPGLTHLLENGHAKVNGGFVPGIQHIKPVEEESNDKILEKVEEIIRNGS